MNNPDYETIYGVGLLDDIHNYFPAILYDSGRFQSLPTMLSYIRIQMNNRFNLFNHGAARAGFRRQERADEFIFPGRVRRNASANASVFAQPAHPLHQNAAHPLHQHAVHHNAVHPLHQNVNESETALRTLLQFLTEEGLAAPFDFNTPVIVAPSQTVLRINTRVISGSSPSVQGSTCSICQDGIISTDTCRSLNPCGHVYHKACIDQWFLRSVFCPTCRHDIRTTQSPRLSSAPAPSPSPANTELPHL